MNISNIVLSSKIDRFYKDDTLIYYKDEDKNKITAYIQQIKDIIKNVSKETAPSGQKINNIIINSPNHFTNVVSDVKRKKIDYNVRMQFSMIYNVPFIKSDKNKTLYIISCVGKDENETKYAAELMKDIIIKINNKVFGKFITSNNDISNYYSQNGTPYLSIEIKQDELPVLTQSDNGIGYISVMFFGNCDVPRPVFSEIGTHDSIN